MKKTMKKTASLLLSISLLSGFFLMVSIKPAHAYIELGSVGFLFQMLIASAFGVLFTLKVYWRNFVGVLSRLLATISGTKTTRE